MKGYQETQEAVKKAMAEFPSVFGLVAYPSEIFRISVAHSYFNDSDVLMLYTEIKKNGVWLSFCKGSVSELRSQVKELRMSVVEQQAEALLNAKGVSTDADNYDLGGPDRNGNRRKQ